MSASTSTREGEPDPRRARVAEKIAHDVVACEPTIYGLLVLDRREGNAVLAVARSPSLPPEARVSQDMVERFAIAATVVWGAAENATKLMGRREFIVGAFRQQLVLLLELQEYEMLLAIRLNRSSNAEHVYSKLARLLGIG